MSMTHTSTACAVSYRTHDAFVSGQKFNDFRATSSPFWIVHCPTSDVCLVRFDVLLLPEAPCSITARLLRKTICWTIVVVYMSCGVRGIGRLSTLLTCAGLQIFEKLIDFGNNIYVLLIVTVMSVLFGTNYLRFIQSSIQVISKNLQKRLHVYSRAKARRKT